MPDNTRKCYSSTCNADRCEYCDHCHQPYCTLGFGLCANAREDALAERLIRLGYTVESDVMRILVSGHGQSKLFRRDNVGLALLSGFTDEAERYKALPERKRFLHTLWQRFISAVDVDVKE